MEYLKEFDPTIDTVSIYPGKIKKNKIASFVGVDHSGSFNAVVDANNNGDFDDDHWYKFKPNPSKENFATSHEEIACAFTYYDGRQLRDTSLWCGPCIAAIPTLKALNSKYAAKGVQILSLAIDKQANKQKLKQIIAEHNMDWPQLYMDAEKAGGVFLKESHTQSFPTTILIDPKGTVIYRGTSEKALNSVDELISRILSKEEGL